MTTDELMILGHAVEVLKRHGNDEAVSAVYRAIGTALLEQK
jgi:hypothetical protein